MKRFAILCLLLLTLTGCGTGRAAPDTTAASSAATAAPETSAPSAVPTEPTVSETAAPTEPPTLADCVEMQLPAELTVTPDAPTAELTVCFPRVELPAEERVCSLTLELNGKPCASWPELELTPGLEQKTALRFSFSLRDEDREAFVVATLRQGDQSLRRGAVVRLDNDEPERYYEKSGEERPYSIDVLRNQNVVIVYGKEGEDYSFPVKTWLCSTGWSTPYGYYRLGGKLEWCALFGGVWGQYVCGIYGNILFHSVPYYYRSKDSLETEEYNKLGSAASMGCVRLPVEGAKWIYDHCPIGTSIHIYDVDELPVPRPTAAILDPDDPRSGWDPTDPDKDNPWNAPFLHPDREGGFADANLKYASHMKYGCAVSPRRRGEHCSSP